MTTTPATTPSAGGSGRAVSAGVLDCAAAAVTARQAADVALLVAAVEWAEANPAGPGVEPSGWGDADLFGEGLLPLGGEGAPSVAEFAPLELGQSRAKTHTDWDYRRRDDGSSDGPHPPVGATTSRRPDLPARRPARFRDAR